MKKSLEKFKFNLSNKNICRSIKALYFNILNILADMNI